MNHNSSHSTHTQPNIAQLTLDWANANRIHCLKFETIASTNDFAKNQTTNEYSETIIVAEHQSQGRGRMQRVWDDSGSGKSLLASFCFLTDKSPQPIFSPLCGLGLLITLKNHFAGDFSLKAPNDVYLGDRKVAGLLIETIQSGQEIRVIIGLGLNVFAGEHLQSEPGRASLIAKGTEPHMDKFTKNWDSFLRDLRREWLILINTQPKILSANLAQELCEALKLNHKHKDLDKVTQNGDLIMKDGKKIAWTQL